jgi:hypothetical protein
MAFICEPMWLSNQTKGIYISVLPANCRAAGCDNVLPGQRLSHAFEGDNIRAGSNGEITNMGTPPKLERKTLQCYFVHYKFHMKSPENKPRSPW